MTTKPQESPDVATIGQLQEEVNIKKLVKALGRKPATKRGKKKEVVAAPQAAQEEAQPLAEDSTEGEKPLDEVGSLDGLRGYLSTLLKSEYEIERAGLMEDYTLSARALDAVWKEVEAEQRQIRKQESDARKEEGGQLPVQAEERDPKPALLSVYYERKAGKYWKPNERGQWLDYTTSGFTGELKCLGYFGNAERGKTASECDLMMKTIRDKCDVGYVGALAGYKEGFYEAERMLITEGPSLIEPEAVPFDEVLEFIETLLNPDEHGQMQLWLFIGWLQRMLDNLRHGKLERGQALVLIGPAIGGKSLLLEIIVILFGGRRATPFGWMAGNTDFNGELCSAETLIVDDEAVQKDMKHRAGFAGKIKQVVAVEHQECHFKYGTKFSLKPAWRLCMALNDDEECMQVLPPLSNDLKDKMMIFQCADKSSVKIPWPNLEREPRMNEIRKQLPGLVKFILDFKIPAQCKQGRESGRYGIDTFWHPTALKALASFNPELQLLELLDCLPYNTSTNDWRGTPTQMEQILKDSKYSYAAKGLIKSHVSLGIKLGRLEKSHPERVKRSRTNRAALWIITKAPYNLGEETKAE